MKASFDSRTRQLTLEQGEAFFVVAKDNTKPFRVADAAAVMSWQARRLAFRGEPPREVLEDVNRYSDS